MITISQHLKVKRVQPWLVQLTVYNDYVGEVEVLLLRYDQLKHTGSLDLDIISISDETFYMLKGIISSEVMKQLGIKTMVQMNSASTKIFKQFGCIIRSLNNIQDQRYVWVLYHND
jgi:hypothetical protein